MEDGIVNLAAIVGTLNVLIGTIPTLLFLGTKRPAEPGSGGSEPSKR